MVLVDGLVLGLGRGGEPRSRGAARLTVFRPASHLLHLVADDSLDQAGQVLVQPGLEVGLQDLADQDLQGLAAVRGHPDAAGRTAGGGNVGERGGDRSLGGVREQTAVVGVRNVFDETPPVVGWGAYSPSVSTGVGYNIPLGAGYSLLDRRIFAAVSYNL